MKHVLSLTLHCDGLEGEAPAIWPACAANDDGEFLRRHYSIVAYCIWANGRPCSAPNEPDSLIFWRCVPPPTMFPLIFTLYAGLPFTALVKGDKLNLHVFLNTNNRVLHWPWICLVPVEADSEGAVGMALHPRVIAAIHHQSEQCRLRLTILHLRGGLLIAHPPALGAAMAMEEHSTAAVAGCGSNRQGRRHHGNSHPEQQQSQQQSLTCLTFGIKARSNGTASKLVEVFSNFWTASLTIKSARLLGANNAAAAAAAAEAAASVAAVAASAEDAASAVEGAFPSSSEAVNGESAYTMVEGGDGGSSAECQQQQMQAYDEGASSAATEAESAEGRIDENAAQAAQQEEGHSGDAPAASEVVTQSVELAAAVEDSDSNSSDALAAEQKQLSVAVALAATADKHQQQQDSGAQRKRSGNVTVSGGAGASSLEREAAAALCRILDIAAAAPHVVGPLAPSKYKRWRLTELVNEFAQEVAFQSGCAVPGMGGMVFRPQSKAEASYASSAGGSGGSSQPASPVATSQPPPPPPASPAVAPSYRQQQHQNPTSPSSSSAVGGGSISSGMAPFVQPPLPPGPPPATVRLRAAAAANNSYSYPGGGSASGAAGGVTARSHLTSVTAGGHSTPVTAGGGVSGGRMAASGGGDFPSTAYPQYYGDRAVQISGSGGSIYDGTSVAAMSDRYGYVGGAGDDGSSDALSTYSAGGGGLPSSPLPLGYAHHHQQQQQMAMAMMMQQQQHQLQQMQQKYGGYPSPQHYFRSGGGSGGVGFVPRQLQQQQHQMQQEGFRGTDGQMSTAAVAAAAAAMLVQSGAIAQQQQQHY